MPGPELQIKRWGSGPASFDTNGAATLRLPPGRKPLIPPFSQATWSRRSILRASKKYCNAMPCRAWLFLCELAICSCKSLRWLLHFQFFAVNTSLPRLEQSISCRSEASLSHVHGTSRIQRIGAKIKRLQPRPVCFRRLAAPTITHMFCSATVSVMVLSFIFKSLHTRAMAGARKGPCGMKQQIQLKSV